MTKTQLIVVAVLALPPTLLLTLLVAMLERCERHLRALHLDLLGPVEDRSQEGMAARREELGVNDGYPGRQIRQAAVGWLHCLDLAQRVLGMTASEQHKRDDPNRVTRREPRLDRRLYAFKSARPAVEPVRNFVCGA